MNNNNPFPLGWNDVFSMMSKLLFSPPSPAAPMTVVQPTLFINLRNLLRIWTRDQRERERTSRAVQRQRRKNEHSAWPFIPLVCKRGLRRQARRGATRRNHGHHHHREEGSSAAGKKVQRAPPSDAERSENAKLNPCMN